MFALKTLTESNNGKIVTEVLSNEKTEKKWTKKLYETCSNKDAFTALSIVKNREIVPGYSDRYVPVATIDVLTKLLEMGLKFTWEVDMYQAPVGVPAGLEANYKFAGKHRVIIKPEVSLGNLLDDNVTLALYVYNSSDRSMRFSIFAGWLVWLCLNGCFSGKSLFTEDGEKTFVRQRHIGTSQQDISIKVEKIAKAVMDYIENHEYEAFSSYIREMMTKEVSQADEMALAYNAMLERIKHLPWYTKKFQSQGGKIEIQEAQVAKFVDDVKLTARRGHEGNTYHQFMQRLQEGVGANPWSEDRVIYVPKSMEYIKHSFNSESETVEAKASKITRLQLRNQDAIQELNITITDMFKNKLEVA